MTDSSNFDQPIAVEAHKLCKSYRKHKSTVARLMDFVNYFLRGKRSPRFFEVSHVLRDINITVRKGESLGIIGQNGCGKSTLLKMVASIISPTAGELRVEGRVASIIELGAGFNPEDTGLQNIGSYLTMYDIPSEAYAEKIEQIIEFSGLGAKVEAPVKSYSSGMVVRLAFAIIAHLDADILLVDEALAVGDAVFSQKCIRFIKAFKQHGTILFVSHDLNALQSFCDEVIWIQDGGIHARGSARSVCEAYLEHTVSADYPELSEKLLSSSRRNGDDEQISLVRMANLEPTSPSSSVAISPEPDLSQGFGGGKAEILDVYLSTSENQPRKVISGGETVELNVALLAKAEIPSPIIGFLVKNSRGVEIFGENTLHDESCRSWHFKENTEYHATFSFNFPLLPSGDYTLTVTIADGDFYEHQQLVWRSDILVLRVVAERFRYGLLGVEGTTITVSQKTTKFECGEVE